MKDTKRAFLWITEILERKGIPFQILGGFAAQIYGVKRELADIDIEVVDGDVKKIIDEVRPYMIFGPARYKDENWDLNLMTLEYFGQEIDICSNEAVIYNQISKQWEKLGLNLFEAKQRVVFTKAVPVVSKDMLIKYKSKLSRDVDREDCQLLANMV